MIKNLKQAICVFFLFISYSISAQTPIKQSSNNDEKSLSELLDSAITISWSNTFSAYDSPYHAIRYTYNSSNLETSQLDDAFDTTWERNYQFCPAYNSSGIETQVIEYSYLGSTLVWGVVARDTFSYDGNGNMTSQLYQFWDTTSWYNYYQSFYIYTTQNNLLTEIDQSWTGSAWSIQDTIFFSYDVNNNLIRKVKQRGALIQQDSFSYDAFNNQLSDVQQNWIDGAWLNNISYLYTYNTENERVGTTLQGWDASQNSWALAETLTDTYDSLHKVKTEVYKLSEDQGYPYQTITYYYYHDITTVVNDIISNDVGISISPNPTNNECTLKTDGLNQMNNAILFDALGRQIMPLFNKEQLTSFNINSNTLLRGVYFVRVTDNDGRVAVVKLVKE